MRWFSCRSLLASNTEDEGQLPFISIQKNLLVYHVPQCSVAHIGCVLQTYDAKTPSSPIPSPMVETLGG